VNKKVSVILPSYNEKENIVELVEQILDVFRKEQIEPEVIVVDDNSSDATADVITERFGKQDRIKVIIRKQERGKASAILTGLLNSSFPVAVIMDANLNHDPRDLPRLLKALFDFDPALSCSEEKLQARRGGVDLIAGSRYVDGAKTGIQPSGFALPLCDKLSLHYGGRACGQGREENKENAKEKPEGFIANRFVNPFMRFMLLLRVSSRLCGLFVLKKEILEKFNLRKVFSGDDYAIRFLYKAKEGNLKILEMPVACRSGRGKIRKTNLLKHLPAYTMTVLRLRSGIGW